MAELTGNRFRERYIFRRVEWPTHQERGSYDYITGGSIEQAVDSELKVTGSFEFEGLETPDVNDLIRIYYEFIDDYGEKFKKPLATLFVSYADVTHVDTLDGIKTSGTIEGGSVLNVLRNAMVGRPYTVKKNVNAIYGATLICRELGLLVNAEPSSAVISADHTFEGGTTYLEIVNWLLDSAGYLPAYPDEMGIVQMISLDTYNAAVYDKDALYPANNLYPEDTLYPYGKDQRGYYFKNDERSIMLPEVEESNDWQTSPNVVRLLYNMDDACIISSAQNMDGSKASLNNRGGREMTYFEEVSELGSGDKRQTMYDLAVAKLQELSTDVEVVQFKHAYVPIRIYDPVLIQYADRQWSGKVDNMVVDLSPSTECQTKIKHVLSEDITIEARAEVLRL